MLAVVMAVPCFLSFSISVLLLLPIIIDSRSILELGLEDDADDDDEDDAKEEALSIKSVTGFDALGV